MNSAKTPPETWRSKNCSLVYEVSITLILKRSIMRKENYITLSLMNINTGKM
jgi:hypothetical protein